MQFYNLGVMSDTHNNAANLQAALQKYDDYCVERIIHCGDVVDPCLLEYFRGRQYDLVLGNNDVCLRAEIAAAVKETGGTLWEKAGHIEWHGKRVFFTHGDCAQILSDAMYSGEWDLICKGHKHIFEKYQHENTIVMNPGAVYYGSYCIVGSDLEIMRFCADDE